MSECAPGRCWEAVTAWAVNVRGGPRDDWPVSELEAWDRRTSDLIEEAYLLAGAGPGGSGSTDLSEGAWRMKRQHLAVPMDADGDWLDVGCANGHLLATLPSWAAERGLAIEPHGLELLPR